MVFVLIICDVLLEIQILELNKTNFENSMFPHNHHSRNDIRKKIEDYSYALTDIIAKGITSVVYRGVNQLTNDHVAIKVIQSKTIKDLSMKNMLDGEIQALRKISHQNVLKCYDIYTTVNNCYIITEFCNQGDLENLIKKRGKLSEQQAIPIFRDLFEGYKSIVEAGYIHRDLKPSNIMIKDHVVKIGDFGSTKRIRTDNPTIKQYVSTRTLHYTSPQALSKNLYGNKADIWSLGVILYEILHGKVPWEAKSQSELLDKIKLMTLSIARDLNEDTKDFIRRSLTVDEQIRMNFYEMSEHPFISRITMKGELPRLLKKQTTFKQNSPKQHQIDIDHINNSMNAAIVNPNFHVKVQKQLQSQISWLRFLNRITEIFPEVSRLSQNNMGLKFIVTKQLICQLKTLKISLYKRENLFNFQSWSKFLAMPDKFNYYDSILKDYGKRYERHRSLYEQWIKAIALQPRLTLIADSNFVRSENLSILSIPLTLKYIKQLWQEIRRDTLKIFQQELPEALSTKAQKLDFLITYYQLNCLLVDNFYDPDYFYRMSKLQHIVDFKPFPLGLSNIKELESKMDLLEIK